MKAVILFLLVVSLSTARALEDSPANRMLEAERYMLCSSPDKYVREMADAFLRNVPTEKLDELRSALIQGLDLEAVPGAIRESLIQTFTADELKALADFYGSPAGQSALNKMVPHMQQWTSVLETEMAKSFKKAQTVFPEIQ